MSLIKKLSMALLLSVVSLSTAHVAASVHEKHPYEFEIRRDPYKFATYFQITSKDTYIGTVKKSALRVRTHYDLSTEHGWQATGIKRICTLGAFYTWASEIDVYDTRGVRIGMIDGQLVTWENARFSLYEYDDAGNYAHVGTAFLDRDFDSFTIFPPDGNLHPIAKLERFSLASTQGVDHWRTQVYHPDRIDDRLVRIFTAFVMDHQDDFVEHKKAQQEEVVAETVVQP